MRPALVAAVGVTLAIAACGTLPLQVDHGGDVGIPDPRTDASSAYDAANGTIVMFGGANRSGVLDETWTWDGQLWRRQHPKHAPPAREFAVMAFDPASNRVVLFAGFACPAAAPDGTIGCEYQTKPLTLTDTWAWDGHDWSRLATQHSPPVPPIHGELGGAGADLVHGRLILLTPESFSPGVGLETWTLRGQDWLRLHPAHAPPAAIFGGPAFDAASRRLIVQQSAGPHVMCPISSPTSSPCGTGLTHNTTWVWTGSDWQDLGAGVGAPHDYGTLVPDGPHGLLLIGLGRTVAWNGSRWTSAEPLPWGTQLRTGWAVAYSEPSDRLVLFSGRSWGTNHLYGDTLGWDGRHWTTLVEAPPSPSAGPLPLCTPSKAEGGEGFQAVPNVPDSIFFDLDFVEPRAGPCHLDVVVHFSLVGSNGALLPIAGNPSQVEVVADLTFENGWEFATFTLSNACGLPPGATAVFSAGDVNVSEPAVVRPCNGPPPAMSITPGVLNRRPLK